MMEYLIYPWTALLGLAGLLFLFTGRDLLRLLLGLELVLSAVLNMILVQGIERRVMTEAMLAGLFIITTSVILLTVGLALLLRYYRLTGRTRAAQAKLLKG